MMSDRAPISSIDTPHSAAEQLLDDGLLKRSQQVESRLRREREKIGYRSGLGAAARFDFGGQVMPFHPAQDCGFESAKAEVQCVALHARQRELYRARIAVGRKLIDDGAARIAESQEFRDLVVGFAGCVVARFSEQSIGEALADFEHMRMAAADDERERGVFNVGAGLQNHRVDVAFDMVDGDERQIAGKAQGLGVGDADQERANQAGACGDGDGGEIVEAHAGFFEAEANHGDNGAQVFARSQLRDHAAVFAVRGQLGRNHRRAHRGSIFHDGRSGFIARGFNSQNLHG